MVGILEEPLGEDKMSQTPMTMLGMIKSSRLKVYP
jgi:hypothetical protein